MRSLSILTLLLVSACPSDPPPIADDIFGEFGDPLPSASAEQLETFERGQEVAEMRFTLADGLGPHFNVASCTACHEKPVVGGSAPRYRNFLLVGQELADGSRTDLGVNGVLPQFEVTDTSPVTTSSCVLPDGTVSDEMVGVPAGEGPEHGVTVRRRQDPAANSFATRNAIPFFGVGLLAEIEEKFILRNVDENDRDGDGISGRPNFDRGFVGRFGRKAQTVSIEGFIRGPLFNHLGITSNPLTPELQAQLPVPSRAEVRSSTMELREDVDGRTDAQAAAPDEPNFDDDDVCDPELSAQALFDLVSWAMLLAPPTPDVPTEATEAGRAIFEEINCAGCHVPALRSPRGMIPAYSDLLLHDMGPDLADGVQMGVAGSPDVCEGGVRGCEWRTQPLWGVAATAPYLHDGRADTLDAAIRLHGGEGTNAREAYEALSDEERQLLIGFLESLGGRDDVSSGLLPPDAPVPGVGEDGGPLRVLDEGERARFVRGREVFDRDFGIEAGLGPFFNGDACRSCHTDPVIGGAGPVDVDVSRHGSFDGSVFTPPARGTMAHRQAVDAQRPPFDDASNVIESRQTPTVLGMGLIDRIPEALILANEDPDDLDEDGVRGRAHVLADSRVGRFGWKANVPSTAEFVRDGMFNELGVTLPEQPGLSFGATSDEDGAADPEVSLTDVEDITFFMNTLAPPARVRTDPTMEDLGEMVFDMIGCATCHRTMETEDGTPVPVYSDFLLHDVQDADFVGIGDADAGHREFRTAPLWGIGRTPPYMHDGRAFTIEDAIAAHFTEAETSRLAYEALGAADRAALLAFLQSL